MGGCLSSVAFFLDAGAVSARQQQQTNKKMTLIIVVKQLVSGFAVVVMAVDYHHMENFEMGTAYSPHAGHSKPSTTAAKAFPDSFTPSMLSLLFAPLCRSSPTTRLNFPFCFDAVVHHKRS
jgi:hypothetical protein